ncbi:hypothetical protein GWI33_013991 [Rhynchophorus ferrugineus]|uniref:Uncharacterized protein n=1 Tax=Rhynchophorus ferrugineus TaxID=354439 RepID=A0A834I5Z1_RHYFE|nr:hypothetical protein GWI33_013991 [Rhynchophorus ferrugineus]
MTNYRNSHRPDNQHILKARPPQSRGNKRTQPEAIVQLAKTGPYDSRQIPVRERSDRIFFRPLQQHAVFTLRDSREPDQPPASEEKRNSPDTFHLESGGIFPRVSPFEIPFVVPSDCVTLGPGDFFQGVVNF